MNCRAAILAPAVLAACAGSTPTPDQPPAPPSVVHYAPHRGSYTAVSAGRQEQQVPGGNTRTEFGLRVHFLSAVTESTDGLRVAIHVDSISEARGAGFASPDLARAAGTTFTGHLGPDGRITHFAGGDTTVSVIRQLAETFEEFFPPIPAEGAAPGAQWLDTATSTTDRDGIKLEIVSITQHEVVGWTSYAGREALHLTTHAEYEISGAGTQMGQAITLDGAGVRDSHYYLGADGSYVGAHSADSSNMNALVVSMGLSIPIIQVRTDSLLPRP